MKNIITIDPRPAQREAMVALLEQHAPIYGVEFTLPTLAHLLAGNIDGQHNSSGGQAAIEIALDCEVPPDEVTYAVVRADPDALGAIAILAIRRDNILALGHDRVSEDVHQRAAYIAKHDAFAMGEWPGPQDPAQYQNEDRIVFGALSALCMDFKKPIADRVALMRDWLENGRTFGLSEMASTIKRNHESAISDAQVVSNDHAIVTLKAHTPGATAIGYCYAPVVVIANDKFRFPGVEGEHLKYTVCQFQAGKYVDLVGAAKALNEIEQNGNWGGSPAIIGSPQGVSSSLSLDEVLEVVKSFVK